MNNISKSTESTRKMGNKSLSIAEYSPKAETIDKGGKAFGYSLNELERHSCTFKDGYIWNQNGNYLRFPGMKLPKGFKLRDDILNVELIITYILLLVSSIFTGIFYFAYGLFFVATIGVNLVNMGYIFAIQNKPRFLINEFGEYPKKQFPLVYLFLIIGIIGIVLVGISNISYYPNFYIQTAGLGLALNGIIWFIMHLVYHGIKANQKLNNSVRLVPIKKMKKKEQNKINSTPKKEDDETLERKSQTTKSEVKMSKNVTNTSTNLIEQKIRDTLIDSYLPRCLPSADDISLKKHSWTWDKNTDCDEPAAYTCHHCKKPLCSKHSYWIPDIQFPILRKGLEKRHRINNFKMRKIGIGLLIAGLNICLAAVLLLIFSSYYYFLTISIIILVIGINTAIAGVVLMNLKQYSVTRNPRYRTTHSSKYGIEIPAFYEHIGYFVAIHCWDCLKKKHALYYKVAREILQEALLKIPNWSQGKKMQEKLSDLEIQDIAVYTANLFFNQFRFARLSAMPIIDTWPLRRMVRDYKQNSPKQTYNYSTTPV